MKVLFVLGWPLFPGGHIFSTASIAACMKKRGHDCFLVSMDGPCRPDVEEAFNIVTHFPEMQEKPRKYLSYLRKIMRVTKDYDIDLIQAQDYDALLPSLIVSVFRGIPLVFTKAGGEVPGYVVPSKMPIVVYSKELLLGLQERKYKNPLFLIPGRIDTVFFSPSAVPDSFYAKYDLPVYGFKIVMAMRIEPAKRRWLDGLFAEIKSSQNMNAVFVIAGWGELLDEYRSKALEINELLARRAVILPGPIPERTEIKNFFNYADIVVGHGRGILEAMACGRPTICLGEFGTATLVEECVVDVIAEFNFSGRHLRTFSELGEPLMEIIRSIQFDARLQELISNFSSRYVIEKYSAEAGARDLLQVYETKLNGKPSVRLRELSKYVLQRFIGQ